MPDISKLLSAEQLAEVLKLDISAERITHLAESGLMPHYQFESRRLFALTESRKWLSDNLLTRIEGCPIPTTVRAVTLTLPGGNIPEPPIAIKSISRYLLPVPITTLDHVLFPGVYFLCQGETVVYVGQSQNVAVRIGTHMGEGRKDFTAAFCMRVPLEDLDYVETQFILALKPKHNHNRNGRIVTPRSGWRMRDQKQIARNAQFSLPVPACS